MSHCVFDDGLICVFCGWKARVARTKRVCPKLVGSPGTLGTRVSRYAAELGAWIAAGAPVRADVQVDGLLSICSENECGRFRDGRCAECGCPVNKSKFGWMNKLRMATTRCPLPVPRWVESVGERPTGVRVGLVLPNLFAGGVERWATSLAKHLVGGKLGASVAAVAFVGQAKDAIESAASELSQYAPIVAAFESSWSYRVPTAAEAVRAIGLGVDVLVVWSISGPLLETLRVAGKPIIGVSHGASDWWMRAAIDVVDEWVAVADAARTPVPSSRVTVIHNGVDLDRLTRTADRLAVRAAVGIPGDVKVAVSIGRLAREKRLGLAVAALRHLPSDWWFWAIGDGHQEWVIRSIAIDAGVQDRVVVSPSREDVGNVLAASDVAVLTSRAEGYCLAAVEALAAGVPLAATRVGVLPELDERLGVPVASYMPLDPTPEQVAHAIAGATSTPQDRREAVAAVIRREHSAEAMARRWAAFLASAVKINP